MAISLTSSAGATLTYSSPELTEFRCQINSAYFSFCSQTAQAWRKWSSVQCVIVWGTQDYSQEDIPAIRCRLMAKSATFGTPATSSLLNSPSICEFNRPVRQDHCIPARNLPSRWLERCSHLTLTNSQKVWRSHEICLREIAARSVQCAIRNTSPTQAASRNHITPATRTAAPEQCGKFTNAAVPLRMAGGYRHTKLKTKHQRQL